MRALAGVAVLLTTSASAQYADSLAAPSELEPKPQPVSLEECIQTALTQNRVLQIERINPEIARLALRRSYGYYDPVFRTQAQKGEQTDLGGFDPADPNADPIAYTARSEGIDGSLTGLLPSGMSYSLSGRYAHAEGTRAMENFDSYKLGAFGSVKQPLLRDFWTDQGRTQIRVSKKNLAISRLILSYVIMDTANQVQQAYDELLFATENLRVRQRLLGARQSSLTGVQRQVEIGSLTVLEEKLAQSEVARVQAELTGASNAVSLAENVLRTLMGHTYSNYAAGPLMPTDRLIILPERLDLSESWRLAFGQRPDLAQMREDLDKSDIQLRYYRNQLFPSLDVVAGYGRRGADSLQLPSAVSAEDASLSAAWDQLRRGDAPNHMYGIVLSTPLSRIRERADYQTGKQLKEQARLRLKQREELVLRQVSDAIHNARSARDRAATTRFAKDTARAALEAEEQKLAGGKSTLFVVFQLQGNLADAESAEVRARADYNKAISQLHFAEGTLADRLNLQLQAP